MDLDTLNEDWIKVRTWGFPGVDNLDQFLVMLGVADAKDADQRTAIQRFADLPAAIPMPSALRTAISKAYGIQVPTALPPLGTGTTHTVTAGGDFDEDKHPRDEHGKFAPTGGDLDTDRIRTASVSAIKDSGAEPIVHGETKVYQQPDGTAMLISDHKLETGHTVTTMYKIGTDDKGNPVASNVGTAPRDATAKGAFDSANRAVEGSLRDQGYKVVDDPTKVIGSGDKPEAEVKPATAEKIVGSSAYRYAVNEWLGGTAYAEDMRSGHSADAVPEPGPIEDKVSQDSRDLLQHAVETEGKPSAGPLYRGLSVDQSVVDQLTPGSAVNLPASSFSPQAEFAIAYADTGLSDHSVLLQVPEGTRALDISARGEKVWGEPESITAGQFVVQSVDSYGTPDHYLSGGKPVSGGGFHIVTLAPAGGGK